MKKKSDNKNSRGSVDANGFDEGFGSGFGNEFGAAGSGGGGSGVVNADENGNGMNLERSGNGKKGQPGILGESSGGRLGDWSGPNSEGRFASRSPHVSKKAKKVTGSANNLTGIADMGGVDSFGNRNFNDTRIPV
jgi:hypothetical protein